MVDTFNQLLDYGALPIINENDSVYIEELLNGDNDCLSAMVATLINADLLIMLTDTHGLYDSNPNENENAKLINVVDEIMMIFIQSPAAQAKRVRAVSKLRLKPQRLQRARNSGHYHER